MSLQPSSLIELPCSLSDLGSLADRHVGTHQPQALGAMQDDVSCQACCALGVQPHKLYTDWCSELQQKTPGVIIGPRLAITAALAGLMAPAAELPACLELALLSKS